jgi:hypothetical protein
MGRRELFERLEAAIARRSPVIWQHTAPGLDENIIRRRLKRAGFEGDIQPIVDIYGWRGGTFLNRDVAAEKFGITPGGIYHFLEFEMAIGHAGHLREAARFHPHLAPAVGRHFPILWDGSDCWYAIDTDAGCNGRVIHIESQSDRTFQDSYSSFDEFLSDLVECNESGEEMRCFA